MPIEQPLEAKSLASDPEKGSTQGTPPLDRTPPVSNDEEKGAPPNEHSYDDNDDNDRHGSLSRPQTNPITRQESMLVRTLSIVRTKDSGRDPGPPPDGGFNAWLQAGLAHLAVFNTWGYINSFGMFQEYYTDSLQRSPSEISWVGSVQLFLLFFIGTFSGRATDAGFFKPVWTAGALLILLGIFMTSLHTTYWQLFLSQAVCMGIGCGLLFCPTVALMPTYFTSKRAIALATAACGTATGGLVFPAVVQCLLPKIGFPWTMRVLGLITFLTLAPGFFFLRQRLPPRRTGPIFEWAAFKERSYALYATAMYINFWALYVGFFYINSYSRAKIGASRTESLYLLMVTNGVGLPGRLIPNAIADYYSGPFNALIPFLAVVAIMLFGWIGVDSMPSMYAFAVIYGFFASGVQSLFPAAATSLTSDLKKTGVRFGMILSIVGIASLTGPPIAGALIERRNGDYLYAQLFAALCLTVGTLTLVAARYAVTGPKLFVKV